MSPASWYQSRLDNPPKKRGRPTSPPRNPEPCWHCGHDKLLHNGHRCGAMVQVGAVATQVHPCSCSEYVEKPPSPADSCSYCEHEAVVHSELLGKQRGRCLVSPCECSKFAS